MHFRLSSVIGLLACLSLWSAIRVDASLFPMSDLPVLYPSQKATLPYHEPLQESFPDVNLYMDEISVDYTPPLMAPAIPEPKQPPQHLNIELDHNEGREYNQAFLFWYMLHSQLTREQAWQAFQQLTWEQIARLWEQMRMFTESFKEYLLFGPLLPAGGGVAPEKYQAEHRTVPGWVLWQLAQILAEKAVEAFWKKIAAPIEQKGEPTPSDSEGSYNGKSGGATRRDYPPRMQQTSSKRQKPGHRPVEPSEEQQRVIFHIPPRSSSITTLRSFMCSTPLRIWIRDMGLFVLPTPADTHCLFHAIDCQLPSRSYRCEGIELRRDAVKKVGIMVRSGQTLEEYLGSSALLFMSSAEPTLLSVLEFLNKPFARSSSTGRDSWGGYEHATLLAKLYGFYAIIFNSTCKKGQWEQRVQLITPSGSYHTLDDAQTTGLLKTVSPHRTFDDTHFPLPRPLLSTDDEEPEPNGPAPILFLSYEEDFQAPFCELPRECQNPDQAMSNVPAHWSALKLEHERGRLADHYNARDVLASIPLRVELPEKVAEATPPPTSAAAKKKRRRKKKPVAGNAASVSHSPIRPTTPIETLSERFKPKAETPKPVAFSPAISDEPGSPLTREQEPDRHEEPQLTPIEWSRITPVPPLLQGSDSYSDKSPSDRPDSPDSGVEEPNEGYENFSDPDGPDPDPEPSVINQQQSPDEPPVDPPPEIRQPARKLKRKNFRLTTPARLEQLELATLTQEDKAFLAGIDQALADALETGTPPETTKKKKKPASNLAREWRPALGKVIKGLQLLNAELRKHNGEREIHIPVSGLPANSGVYREALELFFQAATHYDFPYAWALLALLDEGDSSTLPPYEIRLQMAVAAALHGNRQALALLTDMLFYHHPYGPPQIMLVHDLAVIFQNHPYQGLVTFSLSQEHEYNQLLTGPPQDQALNLLSSEYCSDNLIPSWLNRSHPQPPPGTQIAHDLLELVIRSSVDNPPANLQQRLLEQGMQKLPAAARKVEYTTFVRWLASNETTREARGKKAGKGKKGKVGKNPPQMSDPASVFLVSDACMAGSPETFLDCLKYHVTEAIELRSEWQQQLYHIRRTAIALKKGNTQDWDRLIEQHDSAQQQVLGASFDQTRHNYFKNWQASLHTGPEAGTASAPSPDDPKKTTTSVQRDQPDKDIAPEDVLPEEWLNTLDDRIKVDLKAGCSVAEWENPDSSCCGGNPQGYCHLMAAMTLLQASLTDDRKIRLQALETTIPRETYDNAHLHLTAARQAGTPYAGLLLALITSTQIRADKGSLSEEAFSQLVPLLYDEVFLGVDDALIKLTPLFMQENHPLQLDSPGLPGRLMKLKSRLPRHFHLQFHVTTMTGKTRKTATIILMQFSGIIHDLLIESLPPGQEPLLARLTSHAAILREKSNRREKVILDLLLIHMHGGPLEYDSKAPQGTKLLYALNHSLLREPPEDGGWIVTTLNKGMGKNQQRSAYLKLILSAYEQRSRPEEPVALPAEFQQWQQEGLAGMLLVLTDPVVYQPSITDFIPGTLAQTVPGLQQWHARLMLLEWYSHYLGEGAVRVQRLSDDSFKETFAEKLEKTFEDRELTNSIAARQKFLLKMGLPATEPSPVQELDNSMTIDAPPEIISINEDTATGEIAYDTIGPINTPFSPQPAHDTETPEESVRESGETTPVHSKPVDMVEPGPEFIDLRQWEENPDDYFIDRLLAARHIKKNKLESILQSYSNSMRQFEAGFVNAILGLQLLGGSVRNHQLHLEPNLDRCQSATRYFTSAREAGFPYAGLFEGISLILCQPSQHFLVPASTDNPLQSDIDAALLNPSLIPPLFESAILGVEQAKLLLLTIYNHRKFLKAGVPQLALPALLFRLHQQAAPFRLKLVLNEQTGFMRMLAQMLLTGAGMNPPCWLTPLVEKVLDQDQGMNISRLEKKVEAAVRPKLSDLMANQEVASARAFVCLLKGRDGDFSVKNCPSTSDLILYKCLLKFFDPAYQIPERVRFLQSMFLGTGMFSHYLNMVDTLDSRPSPKEVRKHVRLLITNKFVAQLVPTLDPFILNPRLLTDAIVDSPQNVSSEVTLWHGRMLLLHWLTGSLVAREEVRQQLLQLMALDAAVKNDINRLVAAGGFPSPETPWAARQLAAHKDDTLSLPPAAVDLQQSLSDTQLPLDQRILTDLSLPYSAADFVQLTLSLKNEPFSTEQQLQNGYICTLAALKLLGAQVEENQSIRLHALTLSRKDQKAVLNEARDLLARSFVLHSSPYAGLVYALTLLPTMKDLNVIKNSDINSTEAINNSHDMLIGLIESSLAGVEQAAVLAMHMLTKYFAYQFPSQGMPALLLQLYDLAGDKRHQLKFVTGVNYDDFELKGRHYYGSVPVMFMEGDSLKIYYQLLQHEVTKEQRLEKIRNAALKYDTRAALKMVLALRYDNPKIYGQHVEGIDETAFMSLPLFMEGDARHLLLSTFQERVELMVGSKDATLEFMLADFQGRTLDSAAMRVLKQSLQGLQEKGFFLAMRSPFSSLPRLLSNSNLDTWRKEIQPWAAAMTLLHLVLVHNDQDRSAEEEARLLQELKALTGQPGFLLHQMIMIRWYLLLEAILPSMPAELQLLLESLIESAAQENPKAP